MRMVKILKMRMVNMMKIRRPDPRRRMGKMIMSSNMWGIKIKRRVRVIQVIPQLRYTPSTTNSFYTTF